MHKNKIIFVFLTILMIIYSIYTYPLNIEKNHQGLLVTKINENKNFKKTIHVKIKGKLYRKLFYNRDKFKGIIEIDNKVYDLDLFSSKSKKYMIGDIQVKRNKEILFITILDNFKGVYIFPDKKSGIHVYAPAENEKDCIEIYKEVVKLRKQKYIKLQNDNF